MSASAIILETPRLLMRKMLPEDAQACFDMNNDPEVVRYTGDGPFASLEEAREFLENYDPYSTEGFGRYAVLQKETGEFIGFCGLRMLKDEGYVDLGYRLVRREWGKGYACEAAEACLEEGFSKFHLPFIVGRVMKENTASIRVLEKLGMYFWKEGDCFEHPAQIYRLDNPQA